MVDPIHESEDSYPEPKRNLKKILCLVMALNLNHQDITIAYHLLQYNTIGDMFASSITYAGQIPMILS